MVTKAGHLLKHVDLSLMEVDIPRVHRFADYTAYAPGIVVHTHAHIYIMT